MINHKILITFTFLNLFISSCSEGRQNGHIDRNNDYDKQLVLQLSSYETANNGYYENLLDAYKKLFEMELDKGVEEFHLVNNDIYFIDKKSWNEMLPEFQQSIIKMIVRDLGQSITAYEADIIYNDNFEDSVAKLLTFIEFKVVNRPSYSPFDFFSEYIQKDIIQSNVGNCWHTSIASLFDGWKKDRIMGKNEFLCHLQNSFEKLAPDVELRFGDLLRLTDQNEEEIHSALFVGISQGNPNIHIYMTKNGKNRGRILFYEI